LTDRLAPDFQPAKVIAVLNRHGVRYVLIGGLAAALNGSPSVTQDIDICHARDDANLKALAGALGEVHARLRGAPPDVPFRLDALTLSRGDSFTFTTDIGWLDILATPAGTAGYEELAANAQRVAAFGETFLVANIDDLIRMKRAAGRPRDRAELEILGALREEIDRGS
jgi:predicted nucleotidyltransferase